MQQVKTNAMKTLKLSSSDQSLILTTVITPALQRRRLEQNRKRPGRFSHTSSPRQEKLFIWPPFFQYNKRILRQKTGGACLYMPQDGHWLASFEVIPPPKVGFSAAKKMKIPH